MHQLLVSKFSYMTIDCKIDRHEVYICRFCLNSRTPELKLPKI